MVEACKVKDPSMKRCYDELMSRLEEFFQKKFVIDGVSYPTIPEDEEKALKEYFALMGNVKD